ncbi:MAG: SDR family oxidoreductase [Bacteroidetes bacterium]|nr:SDR family oxidoreductase [Bacteroidota bacterium]
MKNKVVVITGASSGIGEACAKEFAKQGAKLSLAARSIDKLKLIEKELSEQGYEVLSVKTDVSIEEDCKNLISQTINKFGKIDILINNAGISMRALFADVDLSVIKRLMDVNFWGTVYCTKYALPHLLETKGSLVAITSVAGIHGLPGRTGYSASKFAITGFLQTIRIENLKKGLHVLTFAPGFTTSNVRKAALVADGSHQGETPLKENKLMPAEKVAQILIKSIKKRKLNKVLSLDGKLVSILQHIMPKTLDKLTYKHMAKEPNSPFK